jgi:hypothetical protein
MFGAMRRATDCADGLCPENLWKGSPTPKHRGETTAACGGGRNRRRRRLPQMIFGQRRADGDRSRGARGGERRSDRQWHRAESRQTRFWRHNSKVVERVGVAASLTATGGTTEDATCGWCAPPAVAMRPHSPCSPGAGRRRTSSPTAWGRAGNEPLPADDARAQRWRSMWTCGHYSGRGGHFLDGSFGHYPHRAPSGGLLLINGRHLYFSQRAGRCMLCEVLSYRLLVIILPPAVKRR